MYRRLFTLPMASKDSFFVFGPRGTGKTSWLKQHLNLADIYIDLLDSLTFRQLSANPESLQERIPSDFSGRVIIDEVQRVPSLLNEVHRLIEHNNYKFILTGSSARKLKQKGVNLLAGRAIRYTMHPLVIQELGDNFNLPRVLEFGLLPAIYQYDDPSGYLNTYIDTYLREEVMQEGLTRNIAAFSRFLEVASYSQGNTVNISEIAREISIDRQVVQGYFTILQDLLLAYRLPVFSKRSKRRLITTEKFYYFDVGVYHALRPKGILDTPAEIADAGLETLFYQSVLALIAYNNLAIDVYYWRTTSGIEVDFVLYGTEVLLAFEIKHSKTFQHKMLTGLKQFKQDYSMAQCYLINLGQDIKYLEQDIIVMPMETALKQLPTLLGIKNKEG